MTTTYLGIDVSKDKLDIALGTNRTIRKHMQCSNDTTGFQHILMFAKGIEPRNIHVCLEATGQYSEPVAMFLYRHGYRVSLVNPVCIKNHARSQLRRNKTDKQDAGLIADYCEVRHPRLWRPLSEENKALKALSRRLEDLKELRQQEGNRLHAGTTNETVLRSIHTATAFFDQQIKEVEREIKDLIRRNIELERMWELLQTIPGIGERTATVILAEVPDVTDFENARQLAAFVGLTPENQDSGSSIHKKPRMSKKGNAALRKALYMPAVVAKNHNPIVRAFCERLLEAGKCNMVVIGAAMRKLIHIAYGVLKSGRSFDPNYLSKIQVASCI